MRRATCLFLSGLAIATWTPAESAVIVSFVEPDRYSDAGSYGANGRDATLRGIRQHFERLGERYLKPSQTLKVEVLDIDLAGRLEWWRANAYDVRFMRDITWPRMTLRYALEENGQVTVSAEESIADLNYLMKAGLGRSSDPLRYEKAMLDDWFRARFRRE